MNKDNLKLRVW